MSEDRKEAGKTLDPKQSEELRKQWVDSMSRLSNQNMPKEFKSFLQMIEGLKNDEGALQTLKEEILNHYGE
jgi:hypothetical protein